jgi:hypothetical protein
MSAATPGRGRTPADAPRSDEDLLDDVLGHDAVARHPQRERQHQRVQPIVHLAESALVPADDALVK